MVQLAVDVLGNLVLMVDGEIDMNHKNAIWIKTL